MILLGRDIAWGDFLRTLWRELNDDNLVDFAASVAFSAVLSIFPFLLFTVALAGLVIDPGTLATLIEQIRRVMPPAAAEILIERLHALATGPSISVVTVGAIGAVWAASGAVAALVAAFDTVYDVRESRPFWRVRALCLSITLVAALLFVAAAALALAAPVVAAKLGGTLGALVLWMRWPVAAVIMILIIGGLYYALPDVEQELRFLTPGSVFAVAAWVLASMGFSYYVAHFGRYEVVYGALGGVIVLLLWLWISALVVLAGAEVNAVIEHLSPEGKRTGARTLAERGADVPKSQKRR